MVTSKSTMKTRFQMGPNAFLSAAPVAHSSFRLGLNPFFLSMVPASALWLAAVVAAASGFAGAAVWLARVMPDTSGPVLDDRSAAAGCSAGVSALAGAAGATCADVGELVAAAAHTYSKS